MLQQKLAVLKTDGSRNFHHLKLKIMNIDDIKNVWQKDMNALESRVKINEDKIRQLEFSKAQSSFDKFLKISLAGKNMALVYALVSLFLMTKVWDSVFFAIIVAIGAVAMLFSYGQHSVLKKLDMGTLSIVQLQKEINKFRVHTARTAIYDLTIMSGWMGTAGLGLYGWTSGGDAILNLAKGVGIGVAILLWFLIVYIGSRYIYRDIDVQLKESEDSLAMIHAYENS
mgnify:CR=1 FL=1